MDRPAWQRDALRRIVLQDSLEDDDVAELLQICLADHGITSETTPVPVPEPLSTSHIPATNAQSEKVRLVHLGELSGVNALAPEQGMSFEPDGLTIIFGYNGSGKSGYARVLRAMCHARQHGGLILSNAFRTGRQSIPSARVDFQVGTADRSEVWRQGVDPPTHLSQISFFDADCAVVHVDDTNELAFTPFGLEVLPRLVNVCRQLGGSIADLIREETLTQPSSVANPQAEGGTEVRAQLEGLNSDSDIESFRSLSDLSEQESRRIRELQEALGADPEARARELRNTLTRLSRLQAGIERVAGAFSSDTIGRIRGCLQNSVNKRAAANAAAERAFGGQPLAGVGDDVWQELWAAAKRYSQQKAYPSADFPFVGGDARCVLCQQTLDADARSRLSDFESFIRNDTQQSVEQAQSALAEELAQVEQLTVGHVAYSEYLSDLPESDLELIRSIRRFYMVAWRLRRRILESCDNYQWSVGIEMPRAPDLSPLIGDMLRRVEELETSAEEGRRRTLIGEKNELLARAWLSGVISDVEIEIGRKKRLHSLEGARGDTSTTGITRKSGELTDKYVTDVLRNKLGLEIQELGAGYLPVELVSPRGEYGQKQFKIALQGAAGQIKVGQVLSEGEFRCIALAGFLAELSTEDSGSALIFDDPVCSMDHQWRRKVAERLVTLAGERQVIVFTHDIVFLSDLVGLCSENSVPLRQNHIRRGVAQPGECLDGVPWAAMKIGARLRHLKSLLQTAQSIANKEGLDAYEPLCRQIYGLLRESWERAVEEVLLNGVVIRFDCAVHTQQLRHLFDISEEDIRQISVAMSKSSRFLQGHDEAQAVAEPVPSPNELRQDIVDFECWISEVRRRRR